MNFEEKEKTILIYGASGFVGENLFASINKKVKYKVIPINRNTPLINIPDNPYLIIHSANPARRFFANNNPQIDFIETVEKTKTIFERHLNSRKILISSISCRTEARTPYGGNRLNCEKIALKYDSSIIRLGPMYGGSRTKDTLHDICSGENVYLSGDTKYAYVNVNWIANYISDFLHEFSKKNIYEIGASTTVKLSDIADKVKSQSSFIGKNDNQYPLNFKDGPKAELVFDYALKISREIKESI